jgi:hypothetical protein
MKFIRLTIAVITVFFIYPNSPEVCSQTTSMGIEGGINLANVSTTP